MSKNMKSSVVTLEAYKAALARIDSDTSRLGDKAICARFLVQAATELINQAFEGV
jgi:hypothetical protein